MAAIKEQYNTDAPAQNESTEKTVTTKTSDAAQNADIQGTITLGGSRKSGKIFYRASDPNV